MARRSQIKLGVPALVTLAIVIAIGFLVIGAWRAVTSSSTATHSSAARKVTLLRSLADKTSAAELVIAADETAKIADPDAGTEDDASESPGDAETEAAIESVSASIAAEIKSNAAAAAAALASADAERREAAAAALASAAAAAAAAEKEAATLASAAAAAAAAGAASDDMSTGRCHLRPTNAEFVARFRDPGAVHRLLADDKASYSFLNTVATWQQTSGGGDRFPSGSLVLDIGANTGQYVDAFRAAYGKGVHIHSFEPLNVTYELLRKLKADDARVHVRQVALTNFTGSVTFYSPPISTVKNDLFEFPTGASIGQTEGSSIPIGVVPASTVDVFLRSLDGAPAADGGLPSGALVAPLFMKIDTEGADLAVLRGAAGTLRAGAVEALQFEVNYKWDLVEGVGTLVHGVRLLEALGYDTYITSRNGPWSPVSGSWWDPAYEEMAHRWDSSNLVSIRVRPPVRWLRAFREWAHQDDLVCNGTVPRGR